MRALKLLPTALLSTLLLTGCDALRFYNLTQAPGLRPTHADIPYGPHPRQKLDLYLPQADGGPAPLLVWFYGGGWNSGDRRNYAFVAKRFNAMGYAVAIPDYRLVPEVQFPAFVQDGAAALGRLREFAVEHPATLSLEPMVLAGHSAGAYIAVHVVAGADYLAATGLAAGDIAGIIGLSGPYDFYPYQVAASRAAFGDAPASASQPVAQELGHMPPLLLITGDSDTTVKPRNSQRLAELAPRAQLHMVEGMGHAGSLLALGQRVTSKEAVLDPVTAFLAALNRREVDVVGR